MYLEKRTQWLCRLFSIAFGAALFTMLLRGGYHYYSMGSEKVISAQSDPLSFYGNVIWSGMVFIVTTVLGFFSKTRD